MTAAASLPLDTMQRMELAEGVEVELHPAGPMVRAWALLIDMLWLLLVYLVLFLLFLLLSTVIGLEAGQGVVLLLFFATDWGYHVFFEAGKRAATPGKRVMGLRVVSGLAVAGVTVDLKIEVPAVVPAAREPEQHGKAGGGPVRCDNPHCGVQGASKSLVADVDTNLQCLRHAG